jgi:hypothetical protein
VKADEKGIAGKECAGGALGGVPECWVLLAPPAANNNDTYAVVAKTTNIKGDDFGWFYLNRTSDGTTKRCGYTNGTGDNAAAPNAAYADVASVPAAVIPTEEGKRLCPTGTW